MTSTDIRQESHEQPYELFLAQEYLVVEATEKIAELMEKQGLRKADLARRIGKSRAHVTQLMSGDRNMTLHTLAELLHALGHKARLDVAPIGAGDGSNAEAGHLRPVVTQGRSVVYKFDDPIILAYQTERRGRSFDYAWSHCSADYVQGQAAETRGVYQAA